MNKKIIFILFLLIALPLVSSLNNVATQNESYDIRVTPAANGTIDTVTANITVNDPDGIILVAFQVMTKNTDSQDFNYTLPPSNTTKIGFYDCTTYAFSTIAENEAFSCSFEVNPSGKEYIPEISGPLIFGAILTLMFVSIFLLIVGAKIELFPMKVFLIILSGIVAVMNIGFVAGSFQEFFSNDSALSGSFGALYIAFITLLTAASVFLIIWIVIVAFKIYKIKRGFFIQE
jgi:hypothetical protein